MLRKKEYLGILKKGQSKIQVVQMFNEMYQQKPVIRILERNYYAERSKMKLYCDNCGHIFMQEEQTYVKEQIYIKFGANVTSQYVDTVGRNKKVIAEYIRNQLEEDYSKDQISVKEYMNPFTGSKNR